MAKGSVSAKQSGGRIDLATIAGLVVAIGGIVGGLLLEGGAMGDVLQGTAAIIVIGGTLGAVMVSTPMPVLKSALRAFRDVMFDRSAALGPLIEQLVDFSTRARRKGLVSLEQEALALPDPFLRKALSLGVDGCDLGETRKILELEIAVYESQEEHNAKVFESAGGYCPTIGIIGAVLGLIQVMKKLDDINEVGHGIAVAFVATVYGVGLANILFLPAANKIKARIAHEVIRRELVLEGVSAIIEGLNPQMVRMKLNAYLHDQQESAGGLKAKVSEEAAA